VIDDFKSIVPKISMSGYAEGLYSRQGISDAEELGIEVKDVSV